MKKINVSIPLKMISGQDIPYDQGGNLTIGRALANIVLASKTKKFDAFKSWSLSKKFYDSPDFVELDDADFENLKQIVEADLNYTALILGQICEHFIEISK